MVILLYRTWSSCMWTLTNADVRLSTMKIRELCQTRQQDIQRSQRRKHWPCWSATLRISNLNPSAMSPLMMLENAYSRWMDRWGCASQTSISLKSVFMTPRHLLSSRLSPPPPKEKPRTTSRPSFVGITSTEAMSEIRWHKTSLPTKSKPHFFI